MIPVYVAAKFDARERIASYRDKLAERGYKLVSSWIRDDAGLTYGNITSSEAQEMSVRDIGEIVAVSESRNGVFILDTLDVSATGGREVEFGYAMADALRVYRVGPARNVFHHMVRGFDTWEELLDALPSGFGFGQGSTPL